MNLKGIIEKKDKMADYMVEEIGYIIKNFEKRDSGSKGEKQACDYMAKVLEKDCGCEDVKVESFKLHSGAFYGWIFFTMTLVLLAVGMFFVSPFVSAVLIAAGFIIFLAEFGTYKQLIDPFFKEKTSYNVTAIKKCTGETKRRIIFNGHPDAAWEWPVNYAFGGVGFDMHMVLVVVGALYYLVLSVWYILRNGFDFANVVSDELVFKLALWGLLFVPFVIGLYFMVNYRRVVDGANDNLSGCYMGIAILKALKDEGVELENTEVGVILTGSEECGLRGSKAWCEMHKGEFRDVPTIFYAYDTIYDPKYLMANYRDLNGTVKADKGVCDLFVDCSREIGVPCKKRLGSSFRRCM